LPVEILGFHYPPLARSAGVDGNVTLDCTILPDGTVSDIVVVSGHTFLRSTAISAAKTWRFKWSGVAPQKGTIRLVFEFHLGKRLKTERCPEEGEKIIFDYPNTVKLMSDRPPLEVEVPKRTP